MVKPLPEAFINRFQSYYMYARSWRSLKLVLEDYRTDDKTVKHCMMRAMECGDFEGETLATFLLILTRPERRRVANIVEESCHLN